MSTAPRGKRARTLSTVSGSGLQIGEKQNAEHMQSAQSVLRKRDEEFWYCDGSIILVAGDVEFRIYKGLLADHSPVFKDMFSLPQPPATASPTNDPCPVVYLSDSPDDLRHVLRAYMPKGDYSPFYVSAPSYSYEELSAAIRLGHKYQMAKLLDHAIAYLKKYYVCDFDTWASYPDYTPAGFGFTAHAIGVVNLARLTEETTLLPTALLACCALNEDVVEGFIREDDTREQLTPDDLKRCLAAKDRLIKAAIKIAFCIFRPAVADRCQSRVSCTDTFKIVTANLDSHIDEIANPDLWTRRQMGLDTR
ncbi:hypothetical protein VTO73DRAFT_11981 [Trametes versicolor]